MPEVDAVKDSVSAGHPLAEVLPSGMPNEPGNTGLPSIIAIEPKLDRPVINSQPWLVSASPFDELEG